MTAAVIGANGFLGSCISRKLIADGHRVTAVYNSSQSNIPTQCTKIRAELFLENNKAHPDHIYICVGNFANSKVELNRINSFIYACVVNFPESKFIYISSTNIFGDHSDVIDMYSSYNQPSDYGLSKLAGEFIVKSAKRFVIVRPTYVYGPGITNNSFIPFVIFSAINKREIVLRGDGSRQQDYIFIDDLVNLIVLSSTEIDNNIVLGVSGQSHSNLEVAQIVSSITKASVRFEGAETGASYQFESNINRLNLSWSPITSMENGIKKMI